MRSEITRLRPFVLASPNGEALRPYRQYRRQLASLARVDEEWRDDLDHYEHRTVAGERT